MNSNFAGTKVSSERFNLVNPLALRPSNLRSSATPFVVTLTSRTPGAADTRRTISSRSLRTVGYPPVSRTLSTPALAKIYTNRSTSRAVNSRPSGVKSTPSAGMQYAHRKLHRSVSEILK